MGIMKAYKYHDRQTYEDEVVEFEDDIENLAAFIATREENSRYVITTEEESPKIETDGQGIAWCFNSVLLNEQLLPKIQDYLEEKVPVPEVRLTRTYSREATRIHRDSIEAQDLHEPISKREKIDITDIPEIDQDEEQQDISISAYDKSSFRAYELSNDFVNGRYSGFMEIEGDPENLAAFIASRDYDKRYMITDAADNCVVTTTGDFIDSCPDQRFLSRELAPLLAKMQMGITEIPDVRYINQVENTIDVDQEEEQEFGM